MQTKKFTALTLAVIMMLSLAIGCITPTHAISMAIPKTVSRTTTSITINWDSVKGATKYVIQWRAGTSGSWTYMPSNSTNCAYTLSSLTPGTIYQVKVRACSGSTTLSWSPTMTTCTKPSKVTGLLVSPKGAGVGWNSAGSYCSYQIQVTKDGTTKNYYRGENHNICYLAMKEKGTYTIRVRAYVSYSNNGSTYKIYGDWSNAVKYTV